MDRSDVEASILSLIEPFNKKGIETVLKDLRSRGVKV